MSDDALRSTVEAANALPAGMRLHEFELLRLLGIGGFGIVYLAFDHALEREVAIKEYMPASMAGRTETMHVSLRSQSDAEIFGLGLRSFVNEAKLLARFDHTSLLKVYRFWEANGTAYMAMPVLRGRTLKNIRQTPGPLDAPIDERWLRRLLDPLLGALETLHAAGVYHRDIAPDNVHVEPDGRPVLLDFGAARRVIGDRTQTLTAILKPAYAPIEQYAEMGSVRQGPWTDLYALGATIHFLLLGHPPPPATARAVNEDEQAPLAAQPITGCSEPFLHVVDWMLAPRPGDRPQSVAALREVLEGRVSPPSRLGAAASLGAQWERTLVVHQPPAALPGGPAPAPPAAATRSAVGGVDPELKAPRSPAVVPPVQGLVAASDTAPRRRTVALPLGIGLAAAVAVAAITLWPRKTPELAVAGSASAPVAGAEAATRAGGPAADIAASVPAGPLPGAALAVMAGAGSPSVVASGAAAHATEAKAASAPLTAARSARMLRPARAAAAPPAGAPVAAETATAPTPAPEPPPVAHAPPPPAPAPAPVEPSRPLGPEGLCAGRNPILHFVCMERECLRSKFMQHPECLNWRRSARNPELTGN
jgi:serine/threonine protein kinase